VVEWDEMFHRLDFENELIRDDEVQALLAQEFATIHHRVPLFTLELDAGRSELPTDGL
jgi:hypothetical protein